MSVWLSRFNTFFVFAILFLQTACQNATPSSVPGSVPLSESHSTISGTSPVTADGSSTSTISITLKNLAEEPVKNVIPTFSATDTGGSNSYGTCTATDTNGLSTCTLASTKAESKILRLLTPLDFYGPSVTFEAGAPVAAQSSIEGSGPVSADGVTPSTITIVLRDANSNPVVTTTPPTFSATDTGANNVYGTCSNTDSSGTATCTLTSSTAEVKTLQILTPIADTGGTVAFTAAAASATNSTITGTGPVTANGVSTSTVTITLKDSSNNPIVGTTPTFQATDTGFNNTYGACSVTNASGISTCTLRSNTAETKTLMITSPITKSGGTVTFTGLNLFVPIELTDNGLISPFSPTGATFNRTRTSLNTTDYDGTVTYKFEIVGQNIDTVYRNVQLVNSSDTVMATITVPAGTTADKYFSTSFTPTAGANDYRLRLDGNSALKVQAARIIVRQIGATKTKVFIPLYAFDPGGATAIDTTGNLTTSTDYEQTNSRYFTIWKYIAANQPDLATGTPYTFEVVMSQVSGGDGYASLFKDDGTQITASEVTANTDTPTLVSRSFASAEIADNDEIQFKVKSSGGSARIHKAGLWIALESINKVEVYYRIGRSSYTPFTEVWTLSRGFLSYTDMSNPVHFFEACGAMTSTSTLALLDASSNSSGTFGTVVSGSSLNLSSRGRFRSGPLGLTNENYYLTKFNYSSGAGSTNISSVFLVTQFSN
jgi:hypothetical protein